MVRMLSRESVPRGGAGSKALTKEGESDWFGVLLRKFFFFLSWRGLFFFFFESQIISKIYRVFILERMLSRVFSFRKWQSFEI